MRILRVRKSIYFIFGGIIAIPLIISLIAFLKNNSYWQPLAIIFCFCAIAYMWLKGISIEISEESFKYNRLLRAGNTIKYSEIATVGEELGYKNLSDCMLPPRRIVITPKPGSKKNRIFINPGIFDSSDITYLLSRLEEYMDR